MTFAADFSELDSEHDGQVRGLAVAIVNQNKDNTGQVRVRVSYPWHSAQNQSYPARIAVPMAGHNRGTYFVPEIGDEVLVGFDKGSIEHPYVIGCLWNGVDPAPDSNADGKNDRRMIRTRKGHQLLFDDGEKGVVQLELNDGKKLRIDDDGIALDDGKGNALSIKTSGNAITLETRGTLTLKGQSVSIEAATTMDIKSGTTASLSGALVKIN